MAARTMGLIPLLLDMLGQESTNVTQRDAVGHLVGRRDLDAELTPGVRDSDQIPGRVEDAGTAVPRPGIQLDVPDGAASRAARTVIAEERSALRQLPLATSEPELPQDSTHGGLRAGKGGRGKFVLHF